MDEMWHDFEDRKKKYLAEEADERSKRGVGRVQGEKIMR